MAPLGEGRSMIIGLAGKNRLSKGSCAIHLLQRRKYSIAPPEFDCQAYVLRYRKLGLRICVADVRTEADATFLREQGGIVVHVIAPRDTHCPVSEIAIQSGDFVLHGCSDNPIAMHEQLDRIVLDHELEKLTEARHAAAR